MNKHVRHLTGGTYRPISKASVRLPSTYPVCSETEIAARQVSSMFATLWSDPVGDEKLDLAQQAFARLSQGDGKSEEERIEKIAEEFSALRD